MRDYDVVVSNAGGSVTSASGDADGDGGRRVTFTNGSFESDYAGGRRRGTSE